MFILSTIEDVIEIEPDDFTKRSINSLEDNINAKYSNKVLQKVGLCICFYDLLTASEGLIGHGSGVVNVKCTFRILVLRPFRGEVIEGIISEATPAGLRIRLDELFDDITVPGPSNLLDPSHFDPKEGTWVWTSEDDSRFFFDKGERVRFRVEEEVWTDLGEDDEGGNMLSEAERAALLGADDDDEATKKRKEEERRRKNRTPWRLVASMAQGGMGVLAWW